MRHLKFLVVALLLPLFSNAQTGWDFGLLIGVSNYQGDLVKSTLPSFKQSDLAVSLAFKRYIDTRLAIRGNVAFGKISGSDMNYPDDVFRAKRGVSFESSILELAVMAEFEPLGEARFISNNGNNKVVSPYVFVGLGMSVVDPNVDLSNFKGGDELQALMAKDIAASSAGFKVVLPVGLGFKFDISNQLQIGLEAGIRYPFTDHLDGISFSGNPDKNDLYIISGLNLVYMMKK